MTRPGIDDDRELQRARGLAVELDSEIRSRALALLGLIERELRRDRPRPQRIRRLIARLEALIGDVEFATDEMMSTAIAWASTGMLAVYLAGARFDLATAGARLSADLHSRSLRSSLLRAAAAVDRDTGQALRALANALSAAREIGPDGRLSLSRQARRVLLNRVGRVQYSNGARFPLGSYVEMLLDTRSTLAYNQGAYDGARSRNVEVIQLVDGPGCGLVEHKDPLKADGLLVSLQTANAYPIAHPRCVREFLERPDLRLVDVR